jgi:HEAT repeat protein
VRRPGKFLAASVWTGVLALAAAAASAGDRVRLEGGAVAEGVVVHQTPDEIVLKQGDREIHLPRARVLGVELDPVAPAGDPLLAAKLGDEIPSVRVAAGEEIVRTWPASRGTFDLALSHSSSAVRLEATHLLSREELSDVHDRIVAKVSDVHPSVRMAAVRALRQRKIDDAEPKLIALVASDPDAPVRAEALVTLEIVGTPACLEVVLDQFERETIKSMRRRMLRVLRRITGEDAGEDVALWRKAVERAHARALAPKDPAAPQTPAAGNPAAPAAPANPAPAGATSAPRPVSAPPGAATKPETPGEAPPVPPRAEPETSK